MICFKVCDNFLFWYGNDPSRIQRRFCQWKAISYNELIRCFKIASSILLSLISGDGHIYVSGFKRIHFRSLYENTFVLQCTTQIFLARIYCEIPKELGFGFFNLANKLLILWRCNLRERLLLMVFNEGQFFAMLNFQRIRSQSNLCFVPTCFPDSQLDIFLCYVIGSLDTRH